MFAVLGADLLEVGLDAAIAKAALSTPDTRPSPRGRRLDRLHPGHHRSLRARPRRGVGPPRLPPSRRRRLTYPASAITAIEIRMRRQLERVLRALASRRVGREPAAPLLVEAGEVVGVAKDERGAHDPVDRAAGRPQDRLDVAQALPRLLADGLADDRAARRPSAPGPTRTRAPPPSPPGCTGAGHPSRVPRSSARSPCPCPPPLRPAARPMLGHSSPRPDRIRT